MSVPPRWMAPKMMPVRTAAGNIPSERRKRGEAEPAEEQLLRDRRDDADEDRRRRQRERRVVDAELVGQVVVVGDPERGGPDRREGEEPGPGHPRPADRPPEPSRAAAAGRTSPAVAGGSSRRASRNATPISARSCTYVPPIVTPACRPRCRRPASSAISAITPTPTTRDEQRPQHRPRTAPTAASAAARRVPTAGTAARAAATAAPAGARRPPAARDAPAAGRAEGGGGARHLPPKPRDRGRRSGPAMRPGRRISGTPRRWLGASRRG